MNSAVEELIRKKTEEDKEKCLAQIENALETLPELHKGVSEYELRKTYYPNIYKVMNIIKDYYDNDDILDEFDTDEQFQNIKRRGCWELDSYVENELEYKENSMNKEFQEELDEIDTDVCHKLEDMSPDEWWETVARTWGICSPMDTERMKRGIAKMIEKLNKSNYQTGWRRIAGAFFKKFDKENDTEEKITDDRQKEIV